MAPLLALVLVSWTPPTTYVDGSPPAANEIDGYRLSWSVQNAVQPDVVVAGDAVTHDLGNLTGRVCVTLRAIVDGVESDPSPIACRRVKPNPPKNLEVK